MDISSLDKVGSFILGYYPVSQITEGLSRPSMKAQRYSLEFIDTHIFKIANMSSPMICNC